MGDPILECLPWTPHERWFDEAARAEAEAENTRPPRDWRRDGPLRPRVALTPEPYLSRKCRMDLPF